MVHHCHPRPSAGTLHAAPQIPQPQPRPPCNLSTHSRVFMSQWSSQTLRNPSMVYYTLQGGRLCHVFTLLPCCACRRDPWADYASSSKESESHDPLHDNLLCQVCGVSVVEDGLGMPQSNSLQRCAAQQPLAPSPASPIHPHAQDASCREICRIQVPCQQLEQVCDKPLFLAHLCKMQVALMGAIGRVQIRYEMAVVAPRKTRMPCTWVARVGCWC